MNIKMLNVLSSKLLPRKVPVNSFSSSSISLSTEKLQRFRTTESDCSNHTNEHLGLFYKIPEKEKTHIFCPKGIPGAYKIQTKTFNETCFMVRQPALDVINCLKNIDYTKPVVKFVFYGENGTGKSLSLAHILHYAHSNGFLLVHVPWAVDWMQKCSEFSSSESKEGFMDINIDAAAWLLMFKTQNSHLLSNPEAKTSKEYVWNKREVTSAGSPILSLVEHGINRVKYASDTAVAVCEEVKKLSIEGVFRTLVAADGYNAFFYPVTKVYTDKKEMVNPQKITLTQGFMSLTKSDWKNGVVVLTVDDTVASEKEQKSHFPRYLLGKYGFEHLDPFIPVPVSNYTDKELKSCMDYYRERKWIKDYPGLEEEVKFLSNSNPFRIMKICAAL